MRCRAPRLRRPALARACLPVLALIVSACLVRDDLDDPPPPGRPPVPVRIAHPFARLRIDPVEATFERRDADPTP